jgi:hypothetical protein
MECIMHNTPLEPQENQTETHIEEDVIPNPVSKNKWLYPDDQFGLLQRGFVIDSITYSHKTNPKPADRLE